MTAGTGDGRVQVRGTLVRMRGAASKRAESAAGGAPEQVAGPTAEDAQVVGPVPRWTDRDRRAAARICATVSQLVPALAAALGPRTEVVLHDLTRLPTSIVAIAGSITGRTVGDPATDLGLRAFQAGLSEDLVGYRSELDDGSTLRSSSLFLRDDAGRSLCCLCINSDISALTRARDALQALTRVADLSALTGDEAADGERFPRTLEDLAGSILRDAVSHEEVPVELMQKQHKVAVVQELHRRGFFVMRESVDLAAKALRISRYTVYNYLNELGASDDAQRS